MTPEEEAAEALASGAYRSSLRPEVRDAYDRLSAETRAREQLGQRPVLIVTTNDIPGYRVTEVLGDVFGMIVRVRNMFSNISASLMTITGGEVEAFTKLLTDSRKQARERMWQEARALGANAIIGMRFDCNELGDIMSEVVAYGTAVTIERLPDPVIDE